MDKKKAWTWRRKKALLRNVLWKRRKRMFESPQDVMRPWKKKSDSPGIMETQKTVVLFFEVLFVKQKELQKELKETTHDEKRH